MQKHYLKDSDNFTANLNNHHGDKTVHKWLQKKQSDENYILGIHNGIAKVKYLNTKENRIHIASLGYDIVSVSEYEANELWRSNLLLTAEKINNEAVASEIKQVI